jgi:hypothetical protein
VDTARSDPPTPRARAHVSSSAAGARAGDAQEGAEDPAAGAPGTAGRGVPAARAVGTFPLVTSEYSSSAEGEEKEYDGGRAPPERWTPPPPSPRAAKAAEEQALVAGAEEPATGRSVEGAACTAGVSVHASVASGGAAAAATGTTAVFVEPMRKRKRGFSTLS